MRIHSNGIIIRTTNKKIVAKFKDGSIQEWYYNEFPVIPELIAIIADTTYQIADNHEKGKFNIVVFSIALTKFFAKQNSTFQEALTKMAADPGSQPHYWLRYTSFIPYAKVAADFSSGQLKDLDDLTRFFSQNSPD